MRPLTDPERRFAARYYPRAVWCAKRYAWRTGCREDYLYDAAVIALIDVARWSIRVDADHPGFVDRILFQHIARAWRLACKRHAHIAFNLDENEADVIVDHYDPFASLDNRDEVRHVLDVASEKIRPILLAILDPANVDLKEVAASMGLPHSTVRTRVRWQRLKLKAEAC